MKDSSQKSFLEVHRVSLLVSMLIVASVAGLFYFRLFKPNATRATTISWPFEFSMSIDKSSEWGFFWYWSESCVSVNLTLRNISNKTIQVAWHSYFLVYENNDTLPFNILITDKNDSCVFGTVKDYDYRHIPSPLNKALEPNARLVATFFWLPVWWEYYEGAYSVTDGVYFVKGLTRNMEVIIDDVMQTIELQTPTLSFTLSRAPI